MVFLTGALLGKQPGSPASQFNHTSSKYVDLPATEMLISDAHHTAASCDEAFAASAAKGNDHFSYCQPPLPGGVFSYTYARLGGSKKAIVFNQPQGKIFLGGEGITKKKNGT